MTHPRKEARANSARRAKLAGLWTVIAMVGGGFGASAYTMLNRPPDPVVLCQRGTQIAASTIVLADMTDALTEIQSRRLRRAIEAERDGVPRGGRLSIIAINDGDASQPVELFSGCNPGRSGDVNPIAATRPHRVLGGRRWPGLCPPWDQRRNPPDGHRPHTRQRSDGVPGFAGHGGRHRHPPRLGNEAGPGAGHREAGCDRRRRKRANRGADAGATSAAQHGMAAPARSDGY